MSIGGNADIKRKGINVKVGAVVPRDVHVEVLPEDVVQIVRNTKASTTSLSATTS